MEFLKKNKFWIASFLLVATMVGTWFYATNDLQKKTEARVNAIKSSVGQVDGVMRVSAEDGANAHPNQTTEQGMQEKIQKLAESVLEAWKTRYEAQRGVMKWPEEILIGKFGAEFIREFNKHDPPETLPAENKGQSQKAQRLLRVYQQQIPVQMKYISAIIQSDWKYQDQLDAAAFSESSTNPEPKPAGEEDEEDSDADAPDAGAGDADDRGRSPTVTPPAREIVKWSDNNQALWYRKLTSFLGRDDNEFQTRLPTPSQVYMLQQDLWLLEAIFDIIREVNSRRDENGNPVIGPDGKPELVLANDLAPIKRIDHVVFGREALSLLGEITETQASTSTETVGGRAGFASPSGRRGMSTSPTSSVESDLNFAYLGQPAFHGRYVNSNLEPIEADQIRNVLTDESLPDNNLELVVAKHVPVRLAVLMDERKIPDFLAASANSPFAFEVWQVRVNKHDPEENIKLRGSEGGEEGGGGRGGAGRPAVTGAKGQSGGLTSPSPGTGSSSSPVRVALRKNYDVGVEFYGIVKIYNPPQEKRLLGEQAATASP